MFEASAMLLRCAHLRAEVDVSLSQCSYELSGVLEVNIVVGGAVHDHVLLAAEILGFVGYVCILWEIPYKLESPLFAYFYIATSYMYKICSKLRLLDSQLDS